MDLETARLRLRCYRESDLSDLVALIGNWEVARWVSSVPHPYTEAHGQQWITSVQHEHTAANPRRFAVALKDDDHLIGGGGLDGKIPGDVSADSVLGYWLGQPYWGNGYGREAVAALIQYAFRTLAAKVVSAYTDPDNVASQKILRHCGLEKVGEVELANSTRNGARRVPLFRTPAGMPQNS
jgi:RimJ/RimL family protein N-acetyltransferase